MDIEFIKTAFLTMFVAVDPPGLAPVFLALTASMSARERHTTAWQSVSIALGILLGAALCGRSLLEALGIGMPAFRIAGGLLLFSIAAEMVFERREHRKSQSAESAVAHDHPKSIAAFPLAMPLMAGPGALTAVILQASAAQGHWLPLLALAAVLVAVMLCCLGVFLLAGQFERLLGHSGRVIMSRLLGVLLAALAVQIVGDGVSSFIHLMHN